MPVGPTGWDDGVGEGPTGVETPAGCPVGPTGVAGVGVGIGVPLALQPLAFAKSGEGRIPASTTSVGPKLESSPKKPTGTPNSAAVGALPNQLWYQPVVVV